MSSKLWARDMVSCYWSADTLFSQVSIDHNIDVRYQRNTLQNKAASRCQPNRDFKIQQRRRN